MSRGIRGFGRAGLAAAASACICSALIAQPAVARGGRARQREFKAVANRILGAHSARRSNRPLAAHGFEVMGSNGVKVFVDGEPAGYAGPVPVVSLMTKTRRAMSLYEFQARVTRHRIESDLGGLGTLDMTFTPSGQTGTFRPGGCDRSSYAVKEGAWNGTFDFTGEGGYTTADAIQAPPDWSLNPFAGASTCFVELTGAGVKGVALFAGGERSFSAAQNRGPGGAVNFDATSFEQKPTSLVIREIWPRGDSSSFTYAKSLHRASVQPDSPFSGSARFVATSSSQGGLRGRLKGDLAANFLGRSDVPLAPRPLSARIRHEELHVTH